MFLEFSHLIFVIKEFEVHLLSPSVCEHRELINHLVSVVSDIQMQVNDDLVQHYIIIEGKGNLFLTGFLIDSFLKDLTESVPPSSELFG